ncbi:MAG: S8 family serine peptidase [Chloroflexota bacterium]|nr:S8 family serine peptidase [Chloroflexota bacterium]
MHRTAVVPMSRGFSTIVSIVLAAALAATAMILSGAPVKAQESAAERYIVVLAGTYALDGTYALGGNYALNHEYALQIVKASGGTVTNDLSEQIGVLLVESSSETFYALLSQYALVESIGRDFGVKAVPSAAEMSQYALVDSSSGGGGSEPSADPFESQQWDMQQIRTEQAHAVQAGWRAVDVGILDTGIDAAHADFQDPLGGGTNVDCARGRNSIAFVPDGPGAGTPVACSDNGFHGTHVAGTVAAQANGVGIVGVAPNVTLVPVKVCDSSGYCYASAVVDGITYSGDQKFDVINMSFFVDDNEFQQSTEFKCMDDEVQRTFRKAVERAVQYARNQGVTPVAALGNSDEDLANPSEPYENNCDVVPAETQGVIGTGALGRLSQKAGYSNYGTGAVDIVAPGGTSTGNPQTGVFSTFPGNTYAAISGTSMASPHAAGVAALIVSQYGTLGTDGDVKLSPTKVEAYLQNTAIDIGLPGYDECFGNGRIDAFRAVTGDSSKAYDGTAPHCPEYNE